MQNTNPEKAVTIETTKKITVGFKCDPSLKAKLSKDAQQLDISLSEYVESLISNHYHPEKPVDMPKNVKPDQSLKPDQPQKTCFDNLENRLICLLEEEVSPILVSIEDIKELLISQGAIPIEGGIDEKFKNLSEENETLKTQLAEITDNEGLQQLFERYEGKTLEYQTKDGEVKKIKVSGYSDIITALIETIIDKQ
jgi:hypothetical protein